MKCEDTTPHVRLGSGVGPGARPRQDRPSSAIAIWGWRSQDRQVPGSWFAPLTRMDAARACQLDSVLVFEGPETNRTLSDFPA